MGPVGLAAAAKAEEAEQSQDDDHDQDDHENAEDAPPSLVSRHVIIPRAGTRQTGSARRVTREKPPFDEAGPAPLMGSGLDRQRSWQNAKDGLVAH
jgi:hypothetical protein